MKFILNLEYAALLLLGVCGFAATDWSWWWFAALFFLPDVSMAAYLFGPKAGAWTYNLFHHFGVAVLLYLAGSYFSTAELELAGIMMFSHSSFDRLLGYGLKYTDSFQFTHLGKIGKKRT